MVSPVSIYRKAIIFLFVFTLACSEEKSQKIWIPSWKPTSELTIPRAGFAVAKFEDYLYAIGGVDGKDFLKSIERAQINKNDSLGEWQVISQLPEPRGFISAQTHGNRLYVIGGGNGPFGKNLLRNIVSAPIKKNGEIGEWRTEVNSMLIPRRCAKTFIYEDKLYAVGGFGGALLDTVESAPIKPNGTLGDWQLHKEKTITPRYVNEIKTYKNRVFAIGGHHQNSGQGISSVEYLDVSKANAWKETVALNEGRYAFASALVNERFYVLGGLSGAEYLGSVEFNDIFKLLNGKSWQNTSTLPEKMANFVAFNSNNKIYILGGSTRHQYLRGVWYSEVNESGEIGYWGTKADLQQLKQRKEKHKAAKLPNRGKIIKALNSMDYTYLLVDTPKGNTWIAGPKNELAENTIIRFSEGVFMSNFYSKSLNKRFESILFVGTVEKEK